MFGLLSERSETAPHKPVEEVVLLLSPSRHGIVQRLVELGQNACDICH